MKKAHAIIGMIAVATAVVIAISQNENTECSRGLASAPVDYESLTACEKQALLWEKIQATEYEVLPKLCKFGVSELGSMAVQEIGLKSSRASDFAPEGWTKFLHRRASVAKVKIVARSGLYSGIFQGAECGLLRLSLTYAASGSRPVAPGLALKVFRSGAPSANVSALVSLQGQGKDFDFFRHPMSNIVPFGNGIGQELVHWIFQKVSNYPEELLLSDLAAVESSGLKPHRIVSPRQIFFVPVTGSKGGSEEHDFRQDLSEIPSGSTVYRIHALPEEYADFDYADYDAAKASEFLSESVYIADVVTTSSFVSSSFGDDGIFFRHELRP